MTRLKVLLANLPPLQVDLPQTLKKFTLFPKLPLELRNKVWYFVANTQRQIRVWEWVEYERDYFGLSHAVAGQLPIPAILHTCRHSREEGLRYYTNYLEGCSYSYINTEVDLFVFETPVAVPVDTWDSDYFEPDYGDPPPALDLHSLNITQQKLEDAKHIAILSYAGQDIIEDTLPCLSHWLRCPNLKEVILLADTMVISEKYPTCRRVWRWGEFERDADDTVGGELERRCTALQLFRDVLNNIHQQGSDFEFTVRVKWTDISIPRLSLTTGDSLCKVIWSRDGVVGGDEPFEE
ncbi:hypothetical protein DL98DRAFT_616787 [Cadophora sp. DSE1049]|nr:hypothetical protein DL98DRAFT_616787 [Cadophora sp. DSE1049]